MPEVMFVLKSLVIAVVVMMGLQVKVGNTSIEQQAHQWIQTSSVGTYLQSVAAGAALAIRNAAGMTTDFVSSTFNNDQTTQKAGRLNMNFKRSQKYQEEQAEQEQ